MEREDKSLVLTQKSIDKIKNFWRPVDELICTRIFRKSNNDCYLCGSTPMNRHHVLLNTISNVTIDVDLKCIIRLKKIMEHLGSNKKIYFFNKYREDAELINSKYFDTAEIVQFVPSPIVIEELLSRPNEIKYDKLKSILDFTSKFDDGRENELFHEALDIYVERKYYLYEGIKEFEKGDDVEKIIENYLREEAIDFQERDDYEDSYEYTASEISFSLDDLSPEELGSDEIDWNSHDKE